MGRPVGRVEASIEGGRSTEGRVGVEGVGES